MKINGVQELYVFNFVQGKTKREIKIKGNIVYNIINTITIPISNKRLNCFYLHLDKVEIIQCFDHPSQKYIDVDVE